MEDPLDPWSLPVWGFVFSLASCLFFISTIPVPNDILKCNPKIQQAKSGDQAAHCAGGCDASQPWVLKEDRVLIPEPLRQRRVADRQADVETQHDAQEEFDPLEPARDVMMGVRCGRGASLGVFYGGRRRPGQLRRGRGEWG